MNNFNISKTFKEVSNTLKNLKFMGVTVFEITGGQAVPPFGKRWGTKRLGKGRVKVSNYLSLWREIFRHLSRKLRKIAKFSTSLNALLRADEVKISPIEKITAIIMAAKVEQYIAETCKIQHRFTFAFRTKVPKSCANRIFH